MLLYSNITSGFPLGLVPSLYCGTHSHFSRFSQVYHVYLNSACLFIWTDLIYTSFSSKLDNANTAESSIFVDYLTRGRYERACVTPVGKLSPFSPLITHWIDLLIITNCSFHEEKRKDFISQRQSKSQGITHSVGTTIYNWKCPFVSETSNSKNRQNRNIQFGPFMTLSNKPALTSVLWLMRLHRYFSREH